MKKLFFPIAAVVVLTSMSFTSVNTNLKNETKLGTLEKVSLKDFKSTNNIEGAKIINWHVFEAFVIKSVWDTVALTDGSDAKMNTVLATYN